MNSSRKLKSAHRDCVACLAKTSDETPEESTLILVSMIQVGCGSEDVYRSLCFMHRRRVDNTVNRF